MASAVVDLFVYGLLMSGQSGHAELGFTHRTQNLGPAQVMGIIYDLGDYPGLIPGGTGIVQGELLRFGDSNLLAELDDYELYDPQNLAESDYERVRIPLVGRDQTAWVYVYRRPIAGRPVIASGDWRNR